MLLTLPLAAEPHPGAAVYKAKTCITCHGADGGGNTPAGKAMKTPDLRLDATQKKSDEALTKAITEGQGKMPSFGSAMKPEQVRDVLAYIRTFAK